MMSRPASSPPRPGPRVAVVGAGVFGECHVRACLGAGAEVVAVVDRDGARANEVARIHDVPAWYDDMATMLRLEQPAGVLIATPADTHLSLTRTALEHGCHVLLEKPVTVSVDEADRLLSIPGASARVLPGHVLHFDRTHVELRRLIDRGELGRVMAVSAQRHRDVSHTRLYRHTHPVLLTMIHDIDLCQWMSGSRAVEVSAEARSRSSPAEPDMVFARARTEDGVLWSLRCSWLFPEGTPELDRLEVHGTRGTAVLERSGPDVTLRVYADTPTAEPGARHFRHDPLPEEVRAFCAWLQRGGPPAVTLEEARDGIATAHAIITSAACQGTPTPVPLLPSPEGSPE